MHVTSQKAVLSPRLIKQWARAGRGIQPTTTVVVNCEWLRYHWEASAFFVILFLRTPRPPSPHQKKVLLISC